VLVGNCDAIRYMAHSLVTLRKLDIHPQKEAPPEQWGGLDESLMSSF